MNGSTLIWVGLASLILEALGTVAAIIWLFAVVSTKTEENGRAIAAEIEAREKAIEGEQVARERGEAETRAMAEKASRSAAELSQAMQGEINQELKRIGYELAEVRNTQLMLVKNVAEADGRRQVYESLVQRLLDK